MSTSYLCIGCDGGDLLDGTIPGRVDHCHGTADRIIPGVLGGFRCPCACRYQPNQLHAMANAQHPNDRAAAIARYNELMREAGHVVIDATPVGEQTTVTERTDRS